MKHLIFTLLFIPLISSANLVDQYKAYVVSNGKSPDLVNVRGSAITIFTKPDGTLDWYVWKSNVVGFGAPNASALPSPEQATQILSDYAAAKEAARQQAKPLERRQYENRFFSLIEELYNATGVTNEVTPKLGFPEIRELIDTVQASDPMAAVNYSLELLSIDAALKRYSVLWWDDAIQHEIPEE